MEVLYRFAGGRKMFVQYLTVALLTAAGVRARPPFWEYALAVCAALGITVGGVAYEDSRRRCAAPAVDAGEAGSGYRRPAGWRPEAEPEVDEP
jgi:anti-sigma-K factor RskA